MAELNEKKIEKFLKDLMEIQRCYGSEQRNQKTNRQSEVRELLDKFVAREAKNEN